MTETKPIQSSALAAPTAQQRVEFASLPPNFQKQFSHPECVVFAEARYRVDSADLRVTHLGSESVGEVAYANLERQIGKKTGVGVGGGQINQTTVDRYKTDIQLRLSELPGPSLSGSIGPTNCFFAVTLHSQVSMSLETGDVVQLVFVAGFGEGDTPNNPRAPLHPVLLVNTATGQSVAFGQIPELGDPPLVAVLSVAVALLFMAGIGLFIYPFLNEGSNMCFVGSLGCLCLMVWFIQMVNRLQERSKEHLQKIAKVARNYVVQ